MLWEYVSGRIECFDDETLPSAQEARLYGVCECLLRVNPVSWSECVIMCLAYATVWSVAKRPDDFTMSNRAVRIHDSLLKVAVVMQEKRREYFDEDQVFPSHLDAFTWACIWVKERE